MKKRLVTILFLMLALTMFLGLQAANAVAKPGAGCTIVGSNKDTIKKSVVFPGTQHQSIMKHPANNGNTHKDWGSKNSKFHNNKPNNDKFKATKTGKIYGHKYLDGELEEGWTIYLYKGKKGSNDELGGGDNFVASAVTCSDGSFCFTGLKLSQKYFIYEENRNGISPSSPGKGYFSKVTPVDENAVNYVFYDFYNVTVTYPEIGM